LTIVPFVSTRSWLKNIEQRSLAFRDAPYP
jgi:hypothetical protein